jgi:excisionase family DNA binding protein
MSLFVLSIEEASRELGISRDSFLNLVAEDKAPAIRKLGRRSIILRRDFELWLNRLPKQNPFELTTDAIEQSSGGKTQGRH